MSEVVDRDDVLSVKAAPSFEETLAEIRRTIGGVRDVLDRLQERDGQRGIERAGFGPAPVFEIPPTPPPPFHKFIDSRALQKKAYLWYN